jgi:glycosyltransferase involved in cell wall biosynthesis
VHGILVKEKDSKDLAEKILALYADGERTAKYGENGYNKLNSYYTLQRMTDEMEEVYNGVLNGKPQALAVSEA